MTVSASIVTYRTDERELARCLESLMADGIGRVYIVDNSPDRSLEAFCATRAAVTYIFSGANLGYGAAHNIAIRRAQAAGTRYHLVINSDVYFPQGVIPAITAYMDARPDVAQLIPRVVYPDGRLQHSIRLLPTPLDLFARRFLPRPLAERRNRRYCLEFFDHGRECDVAYHQGSFMFFRVECFAEVGLFDERFFMYPEDIDITRRMHRRYRTMFWPGVTIVHAHRAASYKDRRMLRIHLSNMIKYFNKWGWFIDPERRRFNRRLIRELTSR